MSYEVDRESQPDYRRRQPIARTKSTRYVRPGGCVRCGDTGYRFSERIVNGEVYQVSTPCECRTNRGVKA